MSKPDDELHVSQIPPNWPWISAETRACSWDEQEYVPPLPSEQLRTTLSSFQAHLHAALEHAKGRL